MEPYLNPSSDDIHGVGECGSRGGGERPRDGLEEEMWAVLGGQAGELLWGWGREGNGQLCVCKALTELEHSLCRKGPPRPIQPPALQPTNQPPRGEMGDFLLLLWLHRI